MKKYLSSNPLMRNRINIFLFLSGLIITETVAQNSFPPTGQVIVSGDLLLDGTNKWIFHHPSDGRKDLSIAPWVNNTWDWGKSIVFNAADGGMTVPGNMNMKGEISVDGNISTRFGSISSAGSIGLVGDIVFGGNAARPELNSWIFHTPDDSRHDLYISPWNYSTNGWQWDKGTTFYNNGNVGLAGTLQIGNSAEEYPTHISIPESSHSISKRSVIAFGRYQFISDPQTNGTRHFALYNSNNQSFPLWITNDSKMGVGVTAPETKLHVSGDLRLGGAYNSSSTISFNPSQRIIWSVQNGNYASMNFDASEIVFHKNTTGGVAIGNGGIPTGYKLAVAGKIIAEGVKVRTLAKGWPDYVFEENYDLPKLETVAAYIKENKHLPEIPSAAEVEKNGIDIAEMNAKLLKKVEELMLYVIDLKQELNELKSRVAHDESIRK